MHDLPSEAVGLAVLLVAVVITWRTVTAAIRVLRQRLAGSQAENVLTNIVAALATSVSAQGMFRFFSDRLEMPWWMQPEVFAVFELAQLACALRARRNIRKTGKAGVDGVLVWVMSAISAVLSATDSHGWAALARMVFPFAAAILWERGLSSERKERKRSLLGEDGVQSRLTVERLLVWLRLAEPSGRTASDVDVHRRLYRVARAAKRLRTLQQAGAGKWWRQRWALRRLDTAVAQADEHAGLSTDPARQEELLARIAVQFGAAQLAEVTPLAPWATAAVRPPRLRALRVEREPEARAAEDELWREIRGEVEPSAADRVPEDVPDRIPGEPEKEAGEQEEQERDDDQQDVLEPVPADLERLMRKARRRFRSELDAGTTPSIRTLMNALRIGQDKATEVQKYLKQELAA